jgi:hypothetical protein
MHKYDQVSHFHRFPGVMVPMHFCTYMSAQAIQYEMTQRWNHPSLLMTGLAAYWGKTIVGSSLLRREMVTLPVIISQYFHPTF